MQAFFERGPELVPLFDAQISFFSLHVPFVLDHFPFNYHLLFWTTQNRYLVQTLPPVADLGF